MGNSNLITLLAFDAFNKKEVTQMKGPMRTLREAFSLMYLAEMRLAVFCIVISLILLGITFITKSKVDEISKNKTWLIRIVLIAVLIFSIGGIIDTVWNAAM